MKKVCLVCSNGGHLFELHSLNDFWKSKKRFWVTFSAEDSKFLLKDEIVYNVYAPTNRNIKNLFRNLILAYKILKKEKPNLICSSGAGVGVPFIFVGKFLGIKTVYIESLTRLDNISLSGKMVYFFVDHFLVQWPSLTKKYKRTKYIATNF